MIGRTLRWMMTFLPRGPVEGPRLTILRHHRVYPAGARPLFRLGVATGVLEAQLAWLRSAGLTPVTVGEGLARLAGASSGHWVAMTFDDGYADNVTLALPRLRAAGARATFYLTSGLMERREPPWWDRVAHALETSPDATFEWEAPGGGRVRLERGSAVARQVALRTALARLRVRPGDREAAIARLVAAARSGSPAPCELATWEDAARLAEAGMEIGAHTLSHPQLSLLDAAEQRAEIAGSAALVRERLGLAPAGFAYPGGDHDDTSVAEVRAAGLVHAVTTRSGDVGRAHDPWRLARRPFSEGACLGPTGAFSSRLARAELTGAFDGLRRRVRESAK